MTHQLQPGPEDLLGGPAVTPILVNHVVPTVGFLLREGAQTLLHSRDTYRTEALWQVAKEVPALKAAFIQTSFPNDEWTN